MVGQAVKSISFLICVFLCLSGAYVFNKDGAHLNLQIATTSTGFAILFLAHTLFSKNTNDG